MDIIRYIISGVFLLFGLGIWATATKTKSMGHFLGGACYIGGAAASFAFKSWIPLIIGFGLSHLTRKFIGDPYRLTSETSRSKDYHDISLLIGNSYSSGNIGSETFQNIRKAESNLFAMIEDDNDLQLLLKEQRVDINLVKKIYEALINVGAGQWAGNVWVPVEAITTPYTLHYLITELDGKDLDDSSPNDDINEICRNVLNYFKIGNAFASIDPD